jgi:hypothetical protein
MLKIDLSWWKNVGEMGELNGMKGLGRRGMRDRGRNETKNNWVPVESH